MSRRGFGTFAAVLLGTMVVVQAADSVIRITPIMREKKVLVSFELTDAYDEAVRQSISSGLRTTFSFDVALRVVAWVDRTVATAVVSTSDQYDNLTRQHRLTRTVDGRVEDAMVTDDESVAREWLTTGSGWNCAIPRSSMRPATTTCASARAGRRRVRRCLDGRRPSRVRRSSATFLKDLPRLTPKP